MVGYARWILPPGHCIAEDGSPKWVEAQVPDVSEDEKKQYQELAESAWWSPREDMNSLDDKNHVVMDRIQAEKPYISKRASMTFGNTKVNT